MRKLLGVLLILLGIAFLGLSVAAAAMELFGPFPANHTKSLSQGFFSLARLTELLRALDALIKTVVSMPQWLLFAVIGLILVFTGGHLSGDRTKNRRRA
jgi:hypothetical protein